MGGKRFCRRKILIIYIRVVCCDHTSGYRGRFEVHSQLVCCQKQWHSTLADAHLCIHIGEVSGDLFFIRAEHTWRVSPDGALRDTFGTLRRVFMMPELAFFRHYIKKQGKHTEYLRVKRRDRKGKETITRTPF